jgi:hypothetical protein
MHTLPNLASARVALLAGYGVYLVQRGRAEPPCARRILAIGDRGGRLEMIPRATQPEGERGDSLVFDPQRDALLVSDEPDPIFALVNVEQDDELPITVAIEVRGGVDAAYRRTLELGLVPAPRSGAVWADTTALDAAAEEYGGRGPIYRLNAEART